MPTRTFFLAKFLPGGKKEETKKEEVKPIKVDNDSRQSRKEQHQNNEYSVEPQKPKKAEPIIFNPDEPSLMTIKEKQTFKSKPKR